jgi:type IV pilus assembly protein PilM
MRLSRRNEKTLVGLEIEAGSIAATEVRVNGSTAVSATAIAPLPPDAFQDGEVVDAGVLADSLRTLFSEHKLSKRVRLGIANQRVVVRTLRLPVIDDPKELEAAIRFQAQEQIAMPLDQAVLDHRVVGGVKATEDEAPKIDVVVVAARRDMIESSLAPIRKAGLDPVGVDLSAFGLIRATASSVAEETAEQAGAPAEAEGQAPPPEAKATLYCNVGDASNLAVAKGRACLFTRVAPAGLENISSDLSTTANLTHEHARMWLGHVGLQRPLPEVDGDPRIVSAVRSALESGASAVRDELRLSLDFYGAQEGAVPVGRVVLCGPGSAIPGFAERIESSLSLPLSVCRPAALSALDVDDAARLTLSYGLALDE